jgi:hypothetical protein
MVLLEHPAKIGLVKFRRGEIKHVGALIAGFDAVSNERSQNSYVLTLYSSCHLPTDHAGGAGYKYSVLTIGSHFSRFSC